MIRRIKQLLEDLLGDKPQMLINPSLSEIRKMLYTPNTSTQDQFGNTQKEEYIRFVLKGDFYYIADGRCWTHDQMLKDIGSTRTDFDTVTGFISDDGILTIWKYMFFVDYLGWDKDGEKHPSVVFMSDEEKDSYLKETEFFKTVKPIVKEVRWE